MSIASYEILNGNILIVKYYDENELAEAFMRVQEHYENPDLKGKIFTGGQLKEWYKNKFGKWDYAERWSGFNAPIKYFKPFFEGLFSPLYKTEQEFIDLVARLKKQVRYVIGISYSDLDFDNTRKHEIAHGMFHTNLQYRKKVTKIVKSYDNANLEKFILDMGYDKSVLIDEINSYVVADSEYLDDNRVGYNSLLKKDLQDLFGSLKIEE